MKERPILFSDAMVRAILEDRKTQTRRVAKPNDAGRIKAVGSPKNWHPADPDAAIACPYGQPGDRLWVREAWAPAADNWGAFARWNIGDKKGPRPDIYFRADGGEPFIERWRTSIHMPRWVSRITLEITNVRVQRVQEISESEEDALAEGVQPDGDQRWNPIQAFEHLWDSINASRGYDHPTEIARVDLPRIGASITPPARAVKAIS